MNELKNKLLQTGFFQDNEWLDRYCQLIIENKNTKGESGVTEKHHILQRKYFELKNLKIDNSSENLVNLKYSNHILAHYFLCYCTINELRNANYSSLFLMIGKNEFNYENFYKIEYIDYDNWYKEYIESRKGHLVSEEAKEKMRQAHLGKILTEEHKRKISLSLIGRASPTKGRKASEETKQKQRKSMIGKNAGEKNGMYGKHHTEDARKRMSEKRKGGNNPAARQVVCLDTGKIYSCIKEAAEDTGICRSGISKCCLGQRKTSGKLHWEYYNK